LKEIYIIAQIDLKYVYKFFDIYRDVVTSQKANRTYQFSVDRKGTPGTIDEDQTE
jgi:hypothetical protein